MWVDAFFIWALVLGSEGREGAASKSSYPGQRAQRSSGRAGVWEVQKGEGKREEYFPWD